MEEEQAVGDPCSSSILFYCERMILFLSPYQSCDKTVSAEEPGRKSCDVTATHVAA